MVKPSAFSTGTAPDSSSSILPLGSALQSSARLQSAEDSLSTSILVGGQSGYWFNSVQSPLLDQVSLLSPSVSATYGEIFDSASGTVWTGGWNGSQYLVSGWIDNVTYSHSPHIYLFDDNMNEIPIANYTEDVDDRMSSWWGGDILSASYGDGLWLVSGLGSGCLPYGHPRCGNHMGLGLFNGTYFFDLSEDIPEADYNLYATAFNGTEWLIGGGYFSTGVLYSYDPASNSIGTLTAGLASILGPRFGPVTSVGWNGQYWLIGGEGFIVKLQGNKFTNLTPSLNSALGSSGISVSSDNAVNSIAWGGRYWLLGGGGPISVWPGYGQAWLASFDGLNSQFVNLAAYLPLEVRNHSSSILSSAYVGAGAWILGGYANGSGLLVYLDGYSSDDLSLLVSNYTYVDWVGSDIISNNSETNFTHTGTTPQSTKTSMVTTKANTSSRDSTSSTSTPLVTIRSTSSLSSASSSTTPDNDLGGAPDSSDAPLQAGHPQTSNATLSWIQRFLGPYNEIFPTIMAAATALLVVAVVVARSERKK